MASRGTTFGKLDRERDKKAKAQAKQEKRAARAETVDVVETVQLSPSEEEKILASLSQLHAAYEQGTVSLDDFEARRAELTAKLQIG
ncbi:MAG: hypothetical protein JWO37_2371 [Acidimicrobiales bacterium]|nr:hypothetical protein [Acidimicrobiales bacterium]